MQVHEIFVIDVFTNRQIKIIIIFKTTLRRKKRYQIFINYININNYHHISYQLILHVFSKLDLVIVSSLLIG
jgi:hypothetical protein